MLWAYRYRNWPVSNLIFLTILPVIFCIKLKHTQARTNPRNSMFCWWDSFHYRRPMLAMSSLPCLTLTSLTLWTNCTQLAYSLLHNAHYPLLALYINLYCLEKDMQIDCKKVSIECLIMSNQSISLSFFLSNFHFFFFFCNKCLPRVLLLADLYFSGMLIEDHWFPLHYWHNDHKLKQCYFYT